MTATWTTPADFATSHKVTAAEWNTMNGTAGDMAYLKANAIQSDGSVAAAANIPMGTHKLTGLAAGTTNGDSVRYEQIPATTTISQSDVTGSRALDTSNNHIYQNTSGKIMVVAVGVVCNADSQLHTGIATAYTGSGSPPTVQVGQFGVYLPGAVNSTTVRGTVTFIVPNNYYYKVSNDSVSGSATLVSWVEWTLF